MGWEHSLLGDFDPARVQDLADDGARSAGVHRDLLAELGREPRNVDLERLAASYPWLETVRLPGSGLVVTRGELNLLPDYLGHPEEIESAPPGFLGPLIQSVRSWSVAELDRSAGRRGPLLPSLLPGSLGYPLLGPAAETAEIAAISALGRRHGFAPTSEYSSVLTRNASHFAPFSWYRWHALHLAARALIGQSWAVAGEEREALRLRGQVYAGYADHFLQDSFAAGHLINKTLIMQWYIEWLAAGGIAYPYHEELGQLAEARQPLLHGPGHYDKAAARTATVTHSAVTPGGVPGPPLEPQDVADAATLQDRIAASGVTGGDDAQRRRAYAAYLTMLGSGTVQLATKVAHDHLNKHSLMVAASPDGPVFRMYGDHTMLASGDGVLAAGRAAAASRQAIADLLRDGGTDVDSWEIFDSFPDHVQQEDGRVVSVLDWHRGGELRELCSRLFERPTTRTMRFVMSNAFRKLGAPTDDAAI